MNSILLCTDGSKYGETATRYAAHLAKACRASIRALHVLDIRLLEGPFLADVAGWIGAEAYRAQLPAFRNLLEEKGSAILAAAQELCDRSGVTMEKLLRIGHPAHVILDEAQRADVVVLGQRGEHAEWGGDMAGSIMDRVTHRVRKPGLVTPSEYRAIQCLLVAYDGSEHARNALVLAVELCKGLNARLAIVTVIERGRSRDAVEAIAHEGSETASNLGVAVEKAFCIEGVAASAILGVAHEHQCDMLAIGAYGHSRFRELVLGSTTAHLLGNAHIPVLLVP